MADITFKGNPVHTSGSLPAVGAKAPDFRLVDGALGEKTLADFAGKKKVLTINPSYDTSVCQVSARTFHAKVAARGDVALLVVSADLPFAQKRFCTTEGITAATPLSSFRSTFARDYGVEMVDGPLRGLTARAVVVLDENDVVRHAELVPEIAKEPDFDAALAAL